MKCSSSEPVRGNICPNLRVISSECYTDLWKTSWEQVRDKVAAEVFLEFCQILKDMKTAGLQDLTKERPISETAGVSRQTNQAHLKPFWNRIAFISLLMSDTESWFDRAADMERSSRHLDVSRVSGRAEMALTEFTHVHLVCTCIHTHMHTCAESRRHAWSMQM